MTRHSAARVQPDDDRPVEVTDGTSIAAGARSDHRSFRRTMMRGGRSLAIREVAGIVLSLIATVVIFRQVGPEAYGYVGVGLGLSTFLTGVGSLGLNVYAVRRPELDERLPRELMTMTVASALGIALALWLSAPIIEAWTGRTGIAPMVRIVAVAVALRLAANLPTALLEREMRFGLLASIDFAALFAYYLVAIPAVLAGWSYTGIWLGNAIQTAVVAVAVFSFRPVRPALRVRPGHAVEALRYGVSYQSSVWVYSLRDLAAPVLLSRLAGIEALGLVTATTQLVQRLGFFRTIVWRLSLSGLSRIQEDTAAVRRSIAEGMAFQAVLLGGGISLFSAVSTWLLPTLFTTKWEGVPQVLPFLAAATLVNGLFTLHTSALFARGQVAAATKFHVVLVALLWVAALLLIPAWGVWGYCAAELIAFGSYAYLARLVNEDIGVVDYSTTLAVLPFVAVPLFAGPWLPPAWAFAVWVVSAGASIASLPSVRRVLRETLRSAAGAMP